MLTLCAPNRIKVLLFPSLGDIPELLVNDSATFKFTDIGRKPTLCLRWQVNDLRLALRKSLR